MLTERDLKIGGKYLYWSSSKMCHTHVVYEGKRDTLTFLGSSTYVFRDSTTLNEVWTHNLINIAIDNGWVEKFVNEKDDNQLSE